MSPRAKPLLRGALVFLFLGGILLMLWPLGQNAYGWWSQRALRANWAKEPSVTQKKHSQSVKTSKKPAKGELSSHLQTKPSTSRPKSLQKPIQYAPFPPTRIVIPDIQLDAVVVQGIDSGALQRGPGHDPTSTVPGEIGNCVLAGHSNIFGSWFKDLDQLWAGSLIELHTPRSVYQYRVLTSAQVPQTDTSVMAPSTDGHSHLTLITCTKPASPYRHIINAVLVE